MIVLGLDVSSVKTGWALLQNASWSPTEGSYGWLVPGGSTLGARLQSFRNQLVALLELSKPDLVVLEDTFCGPNPKTAKVLNRFSGVAVETCYEALGVEPTIILATQARKPFKLRTKRQAFDFLQEKYGLVSWKFSKHNDITDALLLCLFVKNS